MIYSIFFEKFRTCRLNKNRERKRETHTNLEINMFDRKHPEKHKHYGSLDKISNPRICGIVMKKKIR